MVCAPAYGFAAALTMSLCRSASQANQFVLHAVQSSDRMRIDEWHERFLQPYLRLWSDASQRDSITEVLYLTDISVPHLSHRQLRRAIPLLADCDETGALTLNYFIQAAHGPHIAAPDVEALLYLSPPTNGWILTPAHYDGHGTQTSVHAVLFGGRDQHNLVYTFPVRQPDTRSARASVCFAACVSSLARDGMLWMFRLSGRAIRRAREAVSTGRRNRACGDSTSQSAPHGAINIIASLAWRLTRWCWNCVCALSFFFVF